MPCFHPLSAYKTIIPMKKNGAHSIYFRPPGGFASNIEPCTLPCGQCIGCRLERSRQWAIRCMHEAQMHQNNCFITLTFSPEALDKRRHAWSLDVRDFQKFMKRLRKKYGKNIRFYHCGEYGEKNGRPHYHACIFGFDFPDKELWKITETGHRLYTSASLEKLWPHGFSTIGDVTFESAAYVARYIMKKINGDMAKSHYAYDLYDEQTGELIIEETLKPEYTTMSRRPGIGGQWFKNFIDDVYPHDFVVVNGKKMKPPKFYDNQLKLSRPYEFDEIKSIRKENMLKKQKEALDDPDSNTLQDKEAVQLARLKMLPRNLD